MRAVAKAGLLVAWLALPGAAFGQSMLGNAGGDAPAAPAAPSAPDAPAAPAVPEGPSPDQNTEVVPPAPPIVSAPLAAPMPQVMTPQPEPPGLVQTPVPPANMDNGQAGTDGTGNADNGTPAPDAAAAAPPMTAAPAAPAPPAPDTAASTPPPPANIWVPEKTAQIGLLDKVDGGASTIVVPVGGQTDAGDLQISVLACVTRPPGEIPDDAIFVSIQPVATGATGTASAAPPPGATQADATATSGPAPPGQDTTGQAGAAAGAPIFRGWMIRSIPGATVVGDASETLRVVSCS